MPLSPLQAPASLASPLASDDEVAPLASHPAPCHAEASKRTPRDIVLINPVGDGSGDLTLGDKLARFALSLGCRVTLVRPDPGRELPDFVRHQQPRGVSPQQPDPLQDPLIVIAPSNLMYVSTLRRSVDSLLGERPAFRGDVLLLEEMDFEPNPSRDRHNMSALKREGFRSARQERLGFGEGALGYLPLPAAEIAAIRRHAPAVIADFVDSLNVDLPPEAPVCFAYISGATESSLPVTRFIQHTLPLGVKAATYVIVSGELTPSSMQTYIDELSDALLETKDADERLAKRFHRARLLTLADDAGIQRLREQGAVNGHGGKERPDLTIVLTCGLPQPVFLAAMALARESMATGDQSLSEALSLRGALPFYAAPSWKRGLKEAVIQRASMMGGETLAQDAATRFMSLPRTSLPRPSAIARDALDRSIVAHTADKALLRLFTRPSGEADEPGLPETS